jgi:hypothetical protein
LFKWEIHMLRRTLIAFTTVVALGSVPLTSSAFAAGQPGGHSGGRAAGGHAMGGHASGGHAMGGHAMGGRGYGGGARRVAGGRGYGGGYYGGGYGGGYDCNGYNNGYGYYGYNNGCGYNPGAAIVGGVIGGALNAFGAY